MKVSYNWLNQYFDEKLPPVEKVADVLTMNSSEVEGVERVDGDYILDIKILPNMAHSCLCHRGIAQELSALLDLPMKKYSRDIPDIDKVKKSDLKPQIRIEDKNDCRRYIGRVIENIKINPSPEWLKKRLENLGQRSINNLVDATNFVMLELGQPMHVFDAGKIGGCLIEIKKAINADEIKTLDGKQVILDDTVLTISNSGKALAIAGIKGGTLAEIDEKTKNIILESANFDPVLIRKTAQKIKIQTDASKRYENDLTPELCWEAMEVLTKLIVDIASGDETKVGHMVDAYDNVASRHSLDSSTEQVVKVLGIKISTEEIIDIFRRMNFEYEINGDNFTVKIPFERLDLQIKEDLIEEILKVYGYGQIEGEKKLTKTAGAVINKNFYYANKIKKILSDNGFSEIYGYTFAEKGEIELANSVAPDKKFLRANLSASMAEYLDFNARYSELVDMPQIKIFEISKIFKKSGEQTHFVLGVKTPSANKGLLKDVDVLVNIIKSLESELKITITFEKFQNLQNVIEIDFDKMLVGLPEPTAYDVELPMAPSNMRFEKISVYPFSVRDVAVFVPEGTEEREVWRIIEEEAGLLLVKDRLFDVFTKKLPDGTSKTSYAFRLVLQSFDHTLSEEEITGVMEKITAKLNAQKDWQVR